MSMRDDLQDRINERLNLWIKDSFQLYQIGGISRWAVVDMCQALMAALTSALVVNDISKAEAIVLMDIWMEKQEAKRAQLDE